MTDINKNNYEAFFLDYHEGHLSPKQRDALMDFLEQNEQLYEEFNAYEELILKPAATSFDGKDALKMAAVVSVEDQMIGSVEGELAANEQIALEKHLAQNAEDAAEYALYQKTKLQPIEVTFPYKKDLKQGAKIVPLFRYAIPVAAAASLVLFVFLRGGSLQDYQSREAKEWVTLLAEDWKPATTDYSVPAFVYDTPEEAIVVSEAHQKKKKAPRIPQKQKEAPGKLETTSPAILYVDVAHNFVANPMEEPVVKDPVTHPVQEEFLSPVEYVSTKVDHKVNKVQKTEASSKPLKVLENGLERLTGNDAEITRERTKSKKKWSFKLGKFEISRTKNS